VLTGLDVGDRVAVRGNFLLDSQFQISGLPSLFFAGGQAPPAGHAHGGPTPASATRPQAANATTPPPPATGHEGHSTPPVPSGHKH